MFDLENEEIFVSRDVVFHEGKYHEFLHNDGTNPIAPAVPLHAEEGILVGDSYVNEDAARPEDHNAETIDHQEAAEGLEAQQEIPSIEQEHNDAENIDDHPWAELRGRSETDIDNSSIRPVRNRKPPAHLKDYVCHVTIDPPQQPTPTAPPGTIFPIEDFISYDRLSRTHKAFLASIDAEVEPRSYAQAMKDPRWQSAMAEEIKALEDNNTWSLVPLPPSKKPIGCKWVYKLKRKADGSIDRFKARLVAKGYSQIEGLDFHETFAPVAKLVSVRCLLTISLYKNWELHQLDVNNAFLHGDLDEEVYMQIPPGLRSSQPNMVCRLHKSLYGLKQASRNWFAKFASALKDYGFIQSMADNSLFTYTSGDIFMAILIYVDDLILAGNDSKQCDGFKRYLAGHFRIKDLGSLKYFLGIEVARNSDGLFLCQRKYTLDILTECGMLGARPSAFPMAQQHGLSVDSGEPLEDPTQYRRLIGRLIYLTITRPELCYSVHILSQFMQSPRQPHWNAAVRVLRYLKQNPGQGIFLRKPTSLQLAGYCDSDWASCPTTRRSVTGYFVTLGGCPVSWKTKKQNTVSRSSAEAEYRAMASATSELLWLRALLRSFNIHHAEPMQLFCDNQAALHIAANPVFHERTKHIEIDCHFIREHLKLGDIVTAHVSTRLQLADIFTKALGRDRFTFLLRKLDVLDIHAPT